MTKLEKWVTKMSFSHSNLVTPLELLLGGKMKEPSTLRNTWKGEIQSLSRIQLPSHACSTQPPWPGGLSPLS